jgi:hypothetical protein
VNGDELHQVRIVGNKLNVEKHSTFTNFDVEDNTGGEVLARQRQRRIYG